jgi:LmbE family N-acetylglucosaminyl deacetylase
MTERRVIVLSPHLDDAVLSAWSALTGPGKVQVINVFTGLPSSDVLSPWDRLTGATSSRARMLERLREDELALSRAGCGATALDFPEAQYRQGPLDSHSLRAELERIIDGAASIWAPAGIGDHDDHLQVRDAALELTRVSGATVRLYADLPYAVKYGWPGWVNSHDDDPHLVVEEWWRRFLPANLQLTAEKHELSADDVREKLQALDAYRTQLPGLNGGPLGLLRRPEIIGREVTWAVGG